MKVKQFNDAPLAHYSYAIVSNGKMALVDPSRDPMPYYKYAEQENAEIVAVFESHPHADFVSSHLQISEETGADIYVSKLLGADYKHKAFDNGDSLKMGDVTFKAINTPGHSPDSITIVAEEGKETILFTGDTLFIGDVGRPDLRENVGNMTAKRVELAKDMYHSIQNKFNDLPDDAIVYPAHGAGSLCGKNMSSDPSSTLGNERRGNWAFQKQTEKEFLAEILKDQPFIPSYFGFNVDINKKGAENINRAKGIDLRLNVTELDSSIVKVDIRDQEKFKKAHLFNSINIMASTPTQKFETWLGAIIEPNEAFYIVVDSVDEIDETLSRVVKIGYEKQLMAFVTLSNEVSNSSDELDLKDFKNNQDKYTIVDIRNEGEIAEGKIFEQAIGSPLNELRDNLNEIPTDKPIVVHCAGGYRSAAGSSILENKFKNTKVYDLSDAISEFS
ncbi:MBL fold metallo-hydrolase [Gillisia sp. JM1]|uniref:MBL fold metallo-hydrolase n=1 Tax=Gillisia sp. JM1 TaxID=1283286 RepID=UPI00040BC90C|nr:MBL fold metallo-hydrolase [Gillisia sp. JM1]